MKLSSALAFVPFLPSASQAAGGYSYNPSDQFNPKNWALVNVTDNQCDGNAQSGIDIPSSKCTVFDEYTFTPGTCTMADLQFELHPHAVQATYVGDCEYPKMKIPGDDSVWEAIQFHIHSGSDHAIDGNYFGADFHLVHKEVDGSRLAVLGLFLEPTDPEVDPVFDDLLTQWEGVATNVMMTCALNSTDGVSSPQGSDRRLRRKLEDSFNPYAFAPSVHTTYTYNGSLTTPPCSEIVFWNVVDTPVKLSVREYQRLVNLVVDYVDPASCEPASIAAPSGDTSRPVQPINGRTITRHCPAGYDDSAEVNTETAASAGAPLQGVAGALFGLLVAGLWL